MHSTPPPSLLAGHPWKPSDQTDVQETWKKFGWTPVNPGTTSLNMSIIAEVRSTTHQMVGGGV